jgi:hypothetical protein
VTPKKADGLRGISLRREDAELFQRRVDAQDAIDEVRRGLDDQGPSFPLIPYIVNDDRGPFADWLERPQ